jgi:hypothetical protein
MAPTAWASPPGVWLLTELWLLEEYLPEIRERDHTRFTPVTEVATRSTRTP